MCTHTHKAVSCLPPACFPALWLTSAVDLSNWDSVQRAVLHLYPQQVCVLSSVNTNIIHNVKNVSRIDSFEDLNPLRSGWLPSKRIKGLPAMPLPVFLFFFFFFGVIYPDNSRLIGIHTDKHSKRTFTCAGGWRANGAKRRIPLKLIYVQGPLGFYFNPGVKWEKMDFSQHHPC